MSKSLPWACAVVCFGVALPVFLPPTCGAEWGEPTAADLKIEKALDSPTELAFVETPLAAVLETLGDTHEIPIRIDQRALEDVGVSSEVAVTKEVKGVSLASALGLMLGDHGLTYVLNNEALLVTTPEEAEMMPLARVYPIADLLDPADPSGSAEAVVHAITSCIDPVTWRAVGGRGDLGVIPPARPTALVVRQQYSVQRNVDRLLRCLRGLREMKPAGAAQPASVVPPSTPMTLRIAQALDDATELEFVQAPLRDVVGSIAKMHDVPIVFSAALGDMGVRLDGPVTCRHKAIPLASALQQVLREFDLTYLVDHEVILIVMPEQAEVHLSTVVYPVARVSLARPGEGVPSEAERLMGTITSLIAHDTWANVGGPGTIAPIALADLGALVVTQTRDVHQQLAGLLARPEFQKAVE